jgi:alpha-tubulin suppressor-like RCC1 family protein
VCLVIALVRCSGGAFVSGECSAGAQGCECRDGACDEGLVCRAGRCDAESSGATGTSGGAGASNGSVGATGSTGSGSSGGSTSASGATGGGAGSDGGNEGGEGGGGNSDGYLSGVVALEATTSGTCALLDDRSVYCWGAAGVSTSTTAYPVPVDAWQDVGAFGTGDGHACAISIGSELHCYGYNRSGQLGDGTTTDRYVPQMPVLVSGLSGEPIAVSGGATFGCALLSSGGVDCWGQNEGGQLGDGGTAERLTPGPVSGLGNATALDAGSNHTCALLSDATVACWGYNSSGALGAGSEEAYSPAPKAVSGLTEVIQVSVGQTLTCALLDDRTVRCWGYNIWGQVGDGTQEDRSLPVAVGVSNVARVEAGASHACAVHTNGTVSCWGENSYGQLGTGESAPLRATPDVVPGIASARELALGEAHACALLEDGTVRCWGINEAGTLGDGTRMHRSTPTPVLIAP